MKFTEPRDSNLANQSNRQLNQLNKLWLLGVVGLVTAIATTSLVQAQTPKVPAKPLDAGACPSDTNAAMMPHQGMSNHMMMMTGEAADRHFIEMMIPHHDGAVKMADLALKRSKNVDVLKLATAIKRDQNLEITQMRDWYKQWYKADVPDMASHSMKPSNHMMGMNGDKMGMGNMTGMPSNAEMIPHHKMALMMSNMIVDSDRPELRTLAQNILRSQSQEIDQMRVWYNKF